jgi:hypothetical protein
LRKSRYAGQGHESGWGSPSALVAVIVRRQVMRKPSGLEALRLSFLAMAAEQHHKATGGCVAEGGWSKADKRRKGANTPAHATCAL